MMNISEKPESGMKTYKFTNIITLSVDYYIEAENESEAEKAFFKLDEAHEIDIVGDLMDELKDNACGGIVGPKQVATVPAWAENYFGHKLIESILEKSEGGCEK